MSIYKQTKIKELIKAIKSIENQIDVSCDLLLNIDGELRVE